MEKLYSQVVLRGRLHRANSLTAEIVKTLENAYRMSGSPSPLRSPGIAIPGKSTST